jgi:hypothetical protein
MPSRSKTLAAVGGGCGVFALGVWTFYVLAFQGVRGDDWMVFYTAARTVIEGKIAILYDGDKLTQLLNAHFAAWLGHPLILHPFLYPPHYLLFLVPFGWLPFAAGGIAFLLLTFVALVSALWLFAKDKEERLILAFAALLCPAAAVTVCAGQNTFLTLALLIGGLGLAPRRPVLAGILLGILTFKPQLWLMVPFALIASRQWKTLFSAGVCAVVLAAASVLVFGLGPWRDWIHIMTAPSDLYVRWNATTRLNGLSTYNYVAFLGAPERLANAAQVAATLAAGALVYWVHRRPVPADLGVAIVLAATMMASPHVLLYDSMCVEVAAALFFVHALRNGAPLIDTIVAVPVWLISVINPPTLLSVAETTPLLVLVFLALLVHRALRPRDGSFPDLALAHA